MHIVLILLAALAAVSLLLLFLVFPSARRHPAREKLRGRYIAHRGLHDLAENTPENSLAAFRAAAEQGHMIENDIHLTADGEVVVFHDSLLKRMCGVDGRIEQMTLAGLKKCRLQGTDEQIPTLQECLEAVDGRVPLLIEFKCDRTTCKPLCEAANKILSAYKGEYFVQSFYPPVFAAGSSPSRLREKRCTNACSAVCCSILFPAPISSPMCIQVEIIPCADSLRALARCLFAGHCAAKRNWMRAARRLKPTYSKDLYRKKNKKQRDGANAPSLCNCFIQIFLFRGRVP